MLNVRISYPMIGPFACNDSWSKTPGRIHAWTGQRNLKEINDFLNRNSLIRSYWYITEAKDFFFRTYSKQVASCNGKSNSKWSWSFCCSGCVLVRSRTKDHQNQNKCDEKFNSKSLQIVSKCTKIYYLNVWVHLSLLVQD